MRYFLRKIKHLLGFKRTIVPLDSNIQYLRKHSTSFLLGSANLRFDVKPENRIYVEIGTECLINANYIFESNKGDVRVGNNVHIGGATFISRSSIFVGNDVTMAWDIMIYDHNSHSLLWDERKNDNHNSYQSYIRHNGNSVINKDWSVVQTASIRIEDKVWIGFGVTILKGVTIGEGAIIGAKSVVTKDVEPWTVVAGNPARVVKRLKG